MNKHYRTQIPNSQELKEILSKEARRDIPIEKADAHFPDFSALIKVTESLGLDCDFLKTEYSISDLDNPSVYESADAILNSIAERIEEIDIELLNSLYDYLAEEDKLERADYIFVYGSKSTIRIEKAVELWKAGYAPKILISGSMPIYDQREKNEAETLKEYALQNGVPEENIILESESITLPDNVKRSLNMLDTTRKGITKLILVNSPFAQRRGWCHFMKFSDSSYQFIRANSNASEMFSRKGWYKNEDGIKIIINEYLKMKVSVILNTA